VVGISHSDSVSTPKLNRKPNNHFSFVHSNKLLSHGQNLFDLIYKFKFFFVRCRPFYNMPPWNSATEI
jgi:hypothetical protein